MPPTQGVSEHSFRLLVEGVKDYSIYMLDPEGRVTTWNPGVERIKGYRREEFVGQHFSRFYPPEDVDKAYRALRMAESEGTFEEEGWRVRKDGSRFWAHVVLTAIRDERGNLVGFAKVTRDLTERRRAEAERIRLAQAQEAVRLRDEFLSIASHELKTPLQNVKLQLELFGRTIDKLEDPDAKAQLVQRMKSVDRQVSRLVTISSRLIQLSTVRTGQLPMRLENLLLEPAIRAQVEALSIELSRARCEVRLTLQPGLAAQLDAPMLDEILFQLLSNAIKFGEGRPIEISGREERELVAVSIVDHGIGIAREDLQRIFGKFERAVSSENYSGWGLGLFVARQLAEAMGGSIEASSTPGRGAMFTAKFKRGDSAAGETP